MGSFIAYKPNEQVGFLPFDIAGESPLDLQGRHKELALLDTAYQQQAHLVQIVASSGTGKTTPQCQWVARGGCGIRLVIYWQSGQAPTRATHAGVSGSSVVVVGCNRQC